MTDIIVYDTTLRDGMQGEGMSLSVEEKVRVARILDELGVPMIEAGFPTSNPKELELFERLREAGLGADVCAFGMTRRRGVAAAEDAALRVLAESWTPVSTLVGKTWGLHLEKVVRVDRDENLRMIAESVEYLVASGKRVVYDAEHFFDGFRRRLRLRDRVPARGVRGRRREPDDVRHQRRLAAASGGFGGARGALGAAGGGVGHPHAQRRRVRGGELAGRDRRGRGDGAGDDERLRRALRQRQPDLDHPEPAAEDGLSRACRRWRA